MREYGKTDRIAAAIANIIMFLIVCSPYVNFSGFSEKSQAVYGIPGVSKFHIMFIIWKSILHHC